jgi:hypothetical protein
LALVAVPIGLGVAAVVFTSPFLTAVLLGVSIPEIQDVTGGHLGLHVAASDVMLVFIAARLVADAAASRQQLRILRALRPVWLVFFQYGWLILVLLAIHLGVSTGVKSLQRIELFVLPAVAGVYMTFHGRHILVLRAYVVTTTVLGILWPVLSAHGLTGEIGKNSAGQLIAMAILMVMGVRGLRNLLPCVPLLLIGLGLTASRGSVLALAVGIVVLSVVVGGQNRRVLVTRTIVILVTGLVVFQLLPASDTARLTNFSGAAGASGGYNIDVRFQYARDAEQLIREHPWTGVGVGNYLAGDPAVGTQTSDPHDVLLLEAAEGGYVFLVSFLALIGGTVLALWRMRRVELAPVAAAVLLATMAHGLVDVYWVRGLPVPGFLLVGMACGLASRGRMEASV